jgi:hypothetical protein
VPPRSGRPGLSSTLSVRRLRATVFARGFVGKIVRQKPHAQLSRYVQLAAVDHSQLSIPFAAGTHAVPRQYAENAARGLLAPAGRSRDGGQARTEAVSVSSTESLPVHFRLFAAASILAYTLGSTLQINAPDARLFVLCLVHARSGAGVPGAEIRLSTPRPGIAAVVCWTSSQKNEQRLDSESLPERQLAIFETE